MEYKFKFNTEEEKLLIRKEHSNLYLVRESRNLDESYIILTDVEPPTEPSLEDIVKEQGDKISTLEKENADILLDSASKDIKIKTVEQDVADLTLLIAQGGM